jgi:hypothetical protein
MIALDGSGTVVFVITCISFQETQEGEEVVRSCTYWATKGFRKSIVIICPSLVIPESVCVKVAEEVLSRIIEVDVHN